MACQRFGLPLGPVSCGTSMSPSSTGETANCPSNEAVLRNECSLRRLNIYVPETVFASSLAVEEVAAAGVYGKYRSRNACQRSNLPCPPCPALLYETKKPMLYRARDADHCG